MHIDTEYLVNAILQFYADLFETLQVYCQGLKICMTFGCNPQSNFCYVFRSLNLVNFGSTSTEAYKHWVSCEHNSSYKFSISRCFV